MFPLIAWCELCGLKKIFFILRFFNLVTTEREISIYVSSEADLYFVIVYFFIFLFSVGGENSRGIFNNKTLFYYIFNTVGRWHRLQCWEDNFMILNSE